jgi:hypothetical protein
VERLFRRLKGYRCIFYQLEKLDLMRLGFISFVLVANGLGMRKQALADVASEAPPFDMQGQALFVKYEQSSLHT